ncbi:YolD-like family protein [Salinicoccus roseus]|uniref:YolD-like family protein n=1 Tax=Salinicoccus roseus TaxID=45670 RepID=UPI002301C891|nr:YolD-like family protein [Salinicoccus roseus]
MGLDYREMDISELDSNIPQGRGMIKWQPFATMPEQYEHIAKMIDDQAKCDPPSFDNEVLVMLEERLRRSIGEEVILRYWNDGFEVQLECRVEYIDNRTQLVIVSKGTEVLNIKFSHIYEVM